MSLTRQRLFSLVLAPIILAFALVLVGWGSPQIQIQSPAKNSSVTCMGTPSHVQSTWLRSGRAPFLPLPRSLWTASR